MPKHFAIRKHGLSIFAGVKIGSRDLILYKSSPKKEVYKHKQEVFLLTNKRLYLNPKSFSPRKQCFISSVQNSLYSKEAFLQCQTLYSLKQLRLKHFSLVLKRLFPQEAMP